MGTVGTKSVCPFPFTFPVGVTNRTVEECTVTFAARLDPGWLVYQLVQLVFYGCVGIPVLSSRIYKLRKAFVARGKDYTKTTQFRVYITGLALSVLAIVSAIDPRGYRGWMPVYVFHSVDQVLGASFVLLALMILDFWNKTANLMKKTGVTIMDVTFKLVFFSTLIVFTILLVLGMIYTDFFYLIEAIKLLGGCLVLIYAFIVVVYAVRKIIYRLDPTHSTDSITVFQVFACSYPPYYTSMEKSIMTLRKKFYLWSAVLFIAIIVTFVTGLEHLGFEVFTGGTPDWSWAYSIDEQPEPGLIAGHILYMLAILLIIRSFEVPRAGSQRSGGSRNGSDMEAGYVPPPEAINANPTLNLNQTETLNAPRPLPTGPPTRRVSKIVVPSSVTSDKPITVKEAKAELKAQGRELAEERKAAATRYTQEKKAQRMERKKTMRASQRVRRAATRDSLKRMSQRMRRSDSKRLSKKKTMGGSSGQFSKSVDAQGRSVGSGLSSKLGEGETEGHFEVSMQSLGTDGGSDNGSGSGSEPLEGKLVSQSDRILKRLSVGSRQSNLSTEQLGDAEPFRRISRASIQKRTSAVNKRRRTIKEELGNLEKERERLIEKLQEEREPRRLSDNESDDDGHLSDDDEADQ